MRFPRLDLKPFTVSCAAEIVTQAIFLHGAGLSTLQMVISCGDLIEGPADFMLFQISRAGLEALHFRGPREVPLDQRKQDGRIVKGLTP